MKTAEKEIEKMKKNTCVLFEKNEIVSSEEVEKYCFSLSHMQQLIPAFLTHLPERGR